MSTAMATISWQTVGVLIAFVGLWSGLFLWAIKHMLDRSAADADKRFNDQVRMWDSLAGRILEVERAVAKLLADLPRDYVRREDWIRLATTLTAKFDAMWSRLDDMKGCGNGGVGPSQVGH